MASIFLWKQALAIITAMDTDISTSDYILNEFCGI